MNSRTLLLLTACTAAPLFFGCSKKAQPTAPAPTPVKAAVVESSNQTVFTDFVGQTSADKSITLTARVPGILEQSLFTEGTLVKEGDLLYTIDDKPLQVALDRAKGAAEQAKVAFATSSKDLERVRKLNESGAVSNQDLDAANLKCATDAANVVTTSAALRNAELELGYAKIYAPITGIIGISPIGSGNMVGPGYAASLATILRVDPIRVEFSVDERFFLETIKHKRDKSEADGIFELVLADGSVHPHRGKIEVVDNKVDPKTGTLRINVSFPNPGNSLRPGLFTRVRFPKRVIKDAIAVPQRAVQELQATYSVVVIDAAGKAEYRPVTVGDRVGSLWVIEKGLKPGEKLIVDGAQKVRPGAPVVVLPQ